MSDYSAIPLLEKKQLNHPWLQSEVDTMKFVPYHLQAQASAIEALRLGPGRQWPDLTIENAGVYVVGPAAIGEDFVPELTLYIHLPDVTGDEAKSLWKSENWYKKDKGLLPAFSTFGNFRQLPDPLRRKIQLDLATAGLRIAGPEVPWDEPLPEDPVAIARIIAPHTCTLLMQRGHQTVVNNLKPIDFAQNSRTILYWLMSLVMIEQRVFSFSPLRQGVLIDEYRPEFQMLTNFLVEQNRHPDISALTEGKVSFLRQQLANVLVLLKSHLDASASPDVLPTP